MTASITSFLTTWVTATWDTMLEASPWLAGGFLLAGLLHVLLPTDRIAAHLGGSGWGSVLKASLAGIPLPLCSCSVIPVAASLRKRGAGPGATASFLISTPETGVDSIAISYALLGPFMAVARPVAAFVTALVTGGLINAAARRWAPLPMAATDERCCTSCCESEIKTNPAFWRRLREAFRYAFVEMVVDLAPWLLAGIMLAGLIAALVPAGILEGSAGSGLAAKLIMMLVGLPLYVCATFSTPVAAALIAKGLSPGTALVFLLAGPATNLATMLVVWRDLGRAALVVYVVCIGSLALLAGWLTDLLMRGGGLTEAAVRPPEIVSSQVEWFFAVMMLTLMLNGLRLRARGPKPGVVPAPVADECD